MEAYRILIISAGSPTGYAILDCADLSGYALHTIAADYKPLQRSVDEFILIPKDQDTDADYLASLIDRHRADLVLFGDANLMQCFAENISALESYKDRMVYTVPKLLGIFRDRIATQEWLISNGLSKYSVPSATGSDFEHYSRIYRIPFIAKHRDTLSSMTSWRIHTPQEFDQAKMQIGNDLVAQRIVGNPDNRFSMLIFALGDGLFANGLCLRFAGQRAEVALSNSDITAAATVLTEVAQFKGPAELVFHLHYGMPQLLQIHPFLTERAGLFARLGLNIVDMCIEYYIENERPKKIATRHGVARYGPRGWELANI